VRAYYAAARIPVGRRWWTIAVIVAIYLVSQVALVLVFLPVAGLDDRMARIVAAGFLVFVALYASALMLLIRRNLFRQVRLWRTANANGMTYADRAAPSVFSGTAVNAGSPTLAKDLLFVPGRADAVGYTAGNAATRPGFTLRASGVLQVPLARSTPHIVLENSRARVFRGTGYRFDRHQRLRLEGDFDRTFTLRCPPGYERDALYVFTPDLMAALLDLAADCEVELVDSHLVVYSGRPWRLWRPERFAAVHRTAELLGARVQRRTARYTADVVPGRRDGRRLRHRPSVGTVVSVAFPVLICAYGVFDLLTGG